MSTSSDASETGRSGSSRKRASPPHEHEHEPFGRSPSRSLRVLLFLGMAVITVLVLVLYFTPALGVRSVEISGTTERQRIRDVAAIRTGTPMLRVDESAIRDRLRALPWVDSTRVELGWPWTVRLRVVERSPVAYTRTSKGIRLVDAEGVPFETVPAPPELPELRVHRATADDGATDAALTVLRALPDPVRRELTTIVAEQPDHVRLLLTGGRTVQWGSTARTARKAAILPALLTRPGKVYDVTTPALPTVS
ncbi:cell division protein FtsQ [Saccharopolyspora lacisalsi]|uniref:Cell division protein FtsQ n=1 Tax=Halosaccharopolyspora lacisalsi TaxID=1000566 RepID=A0A839DW65_9PSEU|nr:FtsQ-type POTRA domain-containing protein [Halosaccharopolyspora lacisalsi]MBA8823421.1 cell division protein FtsQ [Halosaccharopolyspora lacisalsi]